MTYLNVSKKLNAVYKSKKLHLVWLTAHLLMNLHLVCQLALLKFLDYVILIYTFLMLKKEIVCKIKI